MADKDEQLPHKNKKRTTKSCLNCGFENPVAKKSCHSCGNPYPKRQKDWDKIYNMGATNITRQREIMEFRADILQYQHDCEVVILMYHKHGNGAGVNYYGTKGAGVSFIGNKSNIPTSDHGQAALKLFRTFIEDYKSHNNPTVPSSSIHPVIDNPSSSVVHHPTTVNTSSSVAHHPTTVNPSSSVVHHPTTVNTSSSVVHHPTTVNTSSSAVHHPTTVNTSSTSIHQTAVNPSEMVCYVKNGATVAAGFLKPDMNSLDGHPIPPGFVCTLITTIHLKHPEPAPLSFSPSSRFLEKGKYFPLPETNLMRATLRGSDNALVLEPYRSSPKIR